MSLTAPNQTSFTEGHERKGGRRKGSQNRITREVKRGLLGAFHNVEDELEECIRAVMYGGEWPPRNRLPKGVEPFLLKPNPESGAKLVISIAEFALPRINRTELTGSDGGPLEFVIRDLGSESGEK